MSRSLPSEARSELKKGGRYEASKDRTYRQINTENRQRDGMNKLRSEDYGRGSRKK